MIYLERRARLRTECWSIGEVDEGIAVLYDTWFSVMRPVVVLKAYSCTWQVPDSKHVSILTTVKLFRKESLTVFQRFTDRTCKEGFHEGTLLPYAGAILALVGFWSCRTFLRCLIYISSKLDPTRVAIYSKNHNISVLEGRLMFLPSEPSELALPCVVDRS